MPSTIRTATRTTTRTITRTALGMITMKINTTSNLSIKTTTHKTMSSPHWAQLISMLNSPRGITKCTHSYMRPKSKLLMKSWTTMLLIMRCRIKGHITWIMPKSKTIHKIFIGSNSKLSNSETRRTWKMASKTSSSTIKNSCKICKIATI